MAKSVKIKGSVRNTEADTLSDAIVKAWEGAALEDKILSAVVQKIAALSKSLTTAIKRDRVLSGLEEADAARDELIRTLGTMLSGYAVVPVEGIKQAAETLLKVFNKYGKSITAEAYGRESSLIESMLEDFGAESLSESIASLTGVSDVLSQLRAAETAFKEATAEYVKSGNAVGESATAIKKQLVAAINTNFVPYLDSALSVDSSYESFADEVFGHIERANAATVSAKKAADSAESASSTESA